MPASSSDRLGTAQAKEEGELSMDRPLRKDLCILMANSKKETDGPAGPMMLN
jgi:hypothetical protein